VRLLLLLLPPVVLLPLLLALLLWPATAVTATQVMSVMQRCS
jgi:hypothetical protein